MVVIGNVIAYEHEEIEVVEENKLPYTLFPKLLYELIIQNKHCIVAAGTHGKTTTSGLIASVLRDINRDPSYFRWRQINRF